MNEVSASALIAAFDSDSEAGSRAKDAVISGAPFEIWLDPLLGSRLRGILRGRGKSLQRRGKPIIGVAECLASLAEKGERGLLVAYVDDRERAGYLFPLYLDPQPLKVVGCIGFGSSPKRGPNAGPE
ncbi:hypothetical protein [Streptantibioticus silvisoli]|uniref:Uncharacterized protein n=1 Tax=Streptantibioticus silvisoli TaxID=2705255 RepID=A0ABT6W2D3_9ACTN|nr:hypothetical protein [Streptantibioticus silvisoli]MDI5964906.1 hypothetical protein [Streptantibioticus silvisoli]